MRPDGATGPAPAPTRTLPRVTLRSLTVAPEALSEALAARFAEIRRQMDVREDVPPEVLDAALRAATAGPADPPADMTDVPFATLDPEGSRDLDQAFHLERHGDGIRLRYAIADLPAFVRPDGAMDAESRLRGVTVYCPDVRVPLHPPVLSEGAASLLPGEVRSAFVWDLTVGPDGDVRERGLTRALVRSTERLSYEDAGRRVADGDVDDRLGLLREIGTRLIDAERRRGGASLPRPQQEVRLVDGRVDLRYRTGTVVEDWNAQLSLLTGMVAADMMLDAGIGVLRTMPPPDERSRSLVRREAAALGIDWPEDVAYGDLLRSLDRADRRHMAFVHAAAALFRGAGYTAIDAEVRAARPEHAAVAAPYAHVTAPLRRLVDRFCLVVCEAVTRATAPPAWAVTALPALPDAMATADRRAGAVERACIDAAEAAVLHGLVGRPLDAVVIDELRDDTVLVRLTDLAVETRASGSATAGSAVRVIVEDADVAAGTATLRLAPPDAGGPGSTV